MLRSLPGLCVCLGLFASGSVAGESGDGRNIPPGVGATVPFRTHFAADARHRGEALHSVRRGELAAEAVTRRAVRLRNEGDFVTFTATEPFDALVVRYALPDAPEGGGLDATLTLRVGDAAPERLPLTSRFAWQYRSDKGGATQNPSALSDPGFYAFGMFEETRHRLPRVHAAGTEIELRKAPGDDAAYYVIDLVDLEQVPPPLPQPEGFLSAADFGAIPDDDRDDTEAIRRGIAAAKEKGTGLYLPPGTYVQHGIFVVDGVAVAGAGMWYTRLQPLTPPAEGDPRHGNLGFQLRGRNVRVADLCVRGVSPRRGQPLHRGVSGGAEDMVLENLWIERCSTGIWLSGAERATVRGCRLRHNKADGVNVNSGSIGVVVENNHARGNGDDSFAAFASSDSGRGKERVLENVVLRRNTSESNYWGNGLGLYGGRGVVAENNLVRGALPNAGVRVCTDFRAWPAEGLVLRGNVVMDSGGRNWGQDFGSFWIQASKQAITGVIMENNVAIGSFSDGLKIQGPERVEVVCRNNVFQGAGGHGIHVLSNALGHITVEGNRFSGIAGETLKDNADPNVWTRK